MNNKLFYMVFSLFCAVFMAGSLSYAYMDRDIYFSHGKSVFFLHGNILIDSEDDLNLKRSGLPRITPSRIENFTFGNRKFYFTDIDDPEKTAVKIQKLRDDYEKSLGTDKISEVSFDLALEYLKLYFYYLKVKYPYYADEKAFKKAELVNEDELFEYLSRARYYIDLLIFPKGMNGNNGQSKGLDKYLESSSDKSFKLDNGLYLSAYFLAFIIETERIAGNWDALSEDKNLNQEWVYLNGQWVFVNNFYAQKTRDWLDKLWKRYSLASPDSLSSDGLASPGADLLFPLFDLFVKYDFLSRVVTDDKYFSSELNLLTISTLKRAAVLQKEYFKGSEDKLFYNTLAELSKKDGGETKFLPYIYFAYRGYPVISEKDYSLGRNVMFKEYLGLYDKALEKIKYNINFRSSVFQDVFFYGVDFNHLMYLEDIIFYYAQRAFQLYKAKGYDGSYEIGESSKASIVYLLAHIMALKDSSSLKANVEPYENMIKSVETDVIKKGSSNWLYLGSVYQNLCSLVDENDAKVLMYAKKSFMTFCRQVNLEYGDNWENYTKLGNYSYGIEFASNFLKLRDLDAANPSSIISSQFNADKILNDIRNNNFQKDGSEI